MGEVEDVQEVTEHAKRLQPTLILIDLMMPPGNSIEVIAQIKNELPRTKIIIHTMSPDETKINAALAAGADGYLLKNPDGEALLQAIRAIQPEALPCDRQLAS